jgi:hypothetical protein
VRRAEDYAVLGARVVVELHTESYAAKPSTGCGRSLVAPTAAAGWPASAPAAPSAARPTAPAAATAPTDPTNPRRGGWLPMPDDPIHPDQLGGQARFRADLVAYLDSLPVGELAELLGELPRRRQEPLGWACS